MGVLQVGAGVALEREDGVPREADRRDRVHREVRVLHGADADRLGERGGLGLRELRVLLADDREGARGGLVEQLLELRHAAAARRERMAVRVRDRAERDMHEVRPGRDEPELLGDREDLLEVRDLAVVGDDDDARGMVVLLARLHRREVGRVVVEPAVLLADDADPLAVLARGALGVVLGEGGLDGPARLLGVEVAQVDDDRAAAHVREALLLEPLDHSGELRLVVALAARRLEDDAEALVDLVERVARHPDEVLPEGAVLRIALLKPHRLGAAGVHPRLVRLRAGVALLVDALELGDGVLRDRLPVGELAVALDDDAELRAPVADVVVADHFVAERAEDLDHGAADHRRADVADVHRLGDVGAGVVDDDGPAGSDLRDAAVRLVLGDRGGARGEGLALDPEIEIARTGDLGLLDEVRERRAREGGLGDLARRRLQRARELHRVRALEVAEAGLGAGDDAAGARGLGAVGEGGGEARAEPGGELLREGRGRVHAAATFRRRGR